MKGSVGEYSSLFVNLNAGLITINKINDKKYSLMASYKN